ncbi:uncharacterized protein LAESUDRAFT_312139 [Laetiporus sulphureus 93-53]|uniref:Uncharacterized protein n=1 Tax=Laetiporus sulphureus 93-53 TaxID=1314785 RepID=A0A165D512_9APHY|nr:uncharacterized protein LAESUDRAFT_312139 [Laetiporus sulphureus 93-53]KZT04166.1 hypothetical protein LAESUDRAFT_312139 [Laetiporus sulphureus 93-53]
MAIIGRYFVGIVRTTSCNGSYTRVMPCTSGEWHQGTACSYECHHTVEAGSNGRISRTDVVAELAESLPLAVLPKNNNMMRFSGVEFYNSGNSSEARNDVRRIAHLLRLRRRA